MSGDDNDEYTVGARCNRAGNSTIPQTHPPPEHQAAVSRRRDVPERML
jgi:hypothetical protein